MSDPTQALYAAVTSGRSGWAWHAGTAVHLPTGVRVSVDVARVPTPYQVRLTERDAPYWLADPVDALRMVQQQATPRYSLDEARRLLCAEECQATGHTLRVQHTADGLPEAVVCRRCPGWWAVTDQHVTYLVDALVMAMRTAGDSLPAVEGAPWYEALRRYDPAAADALAVQAQRRAAQAARLRVAPPAPGSSGVVDAVTSPRLALVPAGSGVAPAPVAG